MAAASRTVRVSGLPADMDEGRLKDKLFIHFLRTRNGGGEIEAVTIVKAAPVSALITFEEPEVARTVLDCSPHVLEVSGKKYELSVTGYREIFDPDQVVTRLSAVMDHTRVPGGAPALRRLQETHRDVHLSYDAALQIYTLYGAYSKVQAALAQLFDQPGNQQSDAVERATSGSWSERLSQNLQVTASEDLRANPRERRPADPLRSPAEVPSSSSQRDLTPGAYGVEDTGQRQGTSPQPAWSPEEDDFLFVDADMFQYLQKYCQNDYQQILRLYGVEAVDLTNQGLTSLYLQSAGGAGENVRDQTTLSLARNAISQFFQTLETKMWRAEFTKSIFSSGKLLQMAKDNLSLRYPTILLKEDDTTIYMIGNRKDVCDAKQFFLDQSLYLCLKSEEDETKDEVVRRCRLAPRFKESGLPPLGGRATDFCLRGGATAASRPKCSGPMLGFNVLPETAQIGERVPGASAQTAAKDILSMSQSSWSPAASTQTNDASFDSGFFKSQPKEAPPSTSQQDTALVPAGPGSTRKRASSFSGTPQRKAQLTPQQSQDDASKSAAGARASSSGPTDQAGRCRQAVYNAEILVSSLVWQHIKDAYSTQVDDLTSGIQTRESFRGDSSIVAVSLRGTSPSQLKSARLSLQELIDSVIPGFSVQKLPLSELGLTDPADETLLACCHDVRSCFPKVTIQITKKNVLVLGPERSCSQVAASLLSVFSKDLRAVIKQQECSIPSTSTSGPAPLVQSAEPEPESSRGTTGAPGSDDDRRTKQSSYGETAQGNGCVSQPRLHKDPVIKDKVRGTGDRNGQQSGLFVSKMVDERGNETKSGTRPGEVASRSVKERLDSSQKDTAQQRCKQREESRCSAETEPLRWGILGQMTFSRLNISIPGHKNNSTLKISYIIPDGIQQEDHPSPGKPFQGGVFEAYLPDSEATRRLLPRLEKAFQQGLSFTVMEREAGAKVTWNCIPHKTSLQGGKSGCGYPDSSYLARLAEVLTFHGIEEPSATFE